MKARSVVYALAALIMLVIVGLLVDSGVHTAAINFPFFGRPETEQQRFVRMLQSARKHVIINEASPFVGDVKNVAFLRTQYAFYNAAQDGDILIMTKTRTILYRPSTDIVVDMISRDEAYRSRLTGGIPTTPTSSETLYPVTAESSSQASSVAAVAQSSRNSSVAASARSSTRSSVRSSVTGSSSSWRLQPVNQSSVPSGWTLQATSRGSSSAKQTLQILR